MADLASKGSNLALTCYLDDSDNENGPILTISGYCARTANWAKFEANALSILGGMPPLRAKDFHHGKGEFKNWSEAKRLDFVDRLYRYATQFYISGITTSINKRDFEKHWRKTPGFQNMSPFGMAFGVAVTSLIGNMNIPELFRPINFVVESGHRNNGNIEKYFQFLKSQPGFDKWLGTLRFAGKSDSRAIQLADFLAFHARRGIEQLEKQGYPPVNPSGPVLDIMNGHMQHQYERLHGEPKPGEMFSPDGLFRCFFVTPDTRGI